jgi:hypothetical protein
MAEPEQPPRGAPESGDGATTKLPYLVIAIAVVSALFVAVAVAAKLLLQR